MLHFWMFLLVALLPAAALANDSSAMLGAGGIELVANDKVELVREDLFLSPTEVRVRYEFHNAGPEDFATEVAFPLPDVDLSRLSEAPIAQPVDDPVNFVGFSVTVDGAAAAFSGEMKAMLGDRDVSALLAAAGVPASRFASGFYEALENADAASREKLSRAGAVVWDAFGNVYPKWTMKTVYHWRQVFPAGQTVVVEHRYKPVLGMSFFSDYDLGAMHETPESGSEADWSIGRAYCVSPSQERELAGMLAGLGERDYGVLSSATLEYILTTANNWAGPIGHFRLEVARDRPDQVVSSCMEGLVPQGDGRFFMEREGYVPEGDVGLLFVNPIQE